MEQRQEVQKLGLQRGKVQLQPYQYTWKTLFEDEAALIRLALQDSSLRIEHIGSTAIEGMDAKPHFVTRHYRVSQPGEPVHDLFPTDRQWLHRSIPIIAFDRFPGRFASLTPLA